ncbi:SDR family oxidoreductase [Sphingomonas histidinilytica]|uniref:NAD(P)-dependent dehydrogenase, short-chain alcohol dehydrogenase family n=1 Tax=Rhizorhabdus histidinilytica TaxID=439228 RepID=A0A1T5BKW7_9SPHN|nr:SDR family oxidoreductase [Rhizorhabdus histidinilytica]MBO9377396.1 SDR family oxidoreductase [Rhizorhabdus histidinilytica]SKB47878.1 NAD(P)-dependent dehydrogenase, short-chain alcohol dehydrogenase family [Rhizorhabdus histidinilytica]
MTLEGKVAIVFGATGAIGSETAKQLAALGADIHLVDREQARERGEALIRSLPGRHGFSGLEITDSAALEALRDRLADDPRGIAVLINAAGFTHSIPHADLDALTDEIIDSMMQTNWRAQFSTIRTMAPLLRKSGDAVVVSLSSIAAFTGIGSNIAYCAAKAGIDVMTKALARVLAPEVRVLAVSPGVVDTSFVPGRGADFSAKVAANTPLGRVASAEEVARAIIACCTHLTYSTGHIVQVDGGRAL